jgi:hypothetical protein
VTLGRGANNTVRILEDMPPEEVDGTLALNLSRVHARLAVKDGALQLCDGATGTATINGTFLNGERIPAGTWVSLRDGDVVCLGGGAVVQLDGEDTPNPWTYTVRDLDAFLAAAAPAGAAAAAPGGAAPASARRASGRVAAREVFSFGAAPAGAPAAAAAAPRPSRRRPAPPPLEEIDLTGDSPPPAPSAKRPVRGSAPPPAVKAEPVVKPAPAGDGAGPSRPTAAAKAAPPGAFDALKAQFGCPVCCELCVATHALVPCGHLFCGECIGSWLHTKRDCPSCRQACTAPPVRQVAIDGAVEAVPLEPDEAETRRDKLASWEAGRATFEAQMKAPWAAAAGGGRGRGGAGGGAAALWGPGAAGGAAGAMGVLHAMLASLGGDAGAADPGAGAGHLAQVQQALAHERARAQARLTALATARARAAAARANEYRAEYAPARGAPRACAACAGDLAAPNALRLGVRPEPQSRAEAAREGYRWYHAECMPPGNYAEARVRGVHNLRGVSASDQATIRARMTQR